MPKKNSLFVDTSGWGCFLDSNEPLHREASVILRRTALDGRGLVTTNYVVIELVALLSSRFHFPRPEVIRAIERLKRTLLLEIIHITPALDDAAWALLKARPDKEWLLVDAASFVVMGNYGLTEALTTDQHFAQAGFVRLLER